MNQLKVLMIGESLSKQGGIVSVQKILLEEMPPGVYFSHIATLVDGSSLQKGTAFAGAIVQLILTLISKDVDLIHTHVSERGSAFRQAVTTFIALLFRKPVIMHTHGSEFHIFYQQLPLVAQKLFCFIYGKCAHFIVLSDYWKQFYIQNLKLKNKKVTVLPNPVRIPEKISQQKNSDTVALIFLGRIGQRKGTFDLVQAFANLPPEHQAKAKLTIAGDGEVSQLRNLVNDLNLSGKISVIDWISPEQRDHLLEQSDVFILPSYNEGLPMALLEAMSWGLPVIATPVGGIPELIHSQENGLLIQPGNLEQLTAAIQSLIENQKLRLMLGKAARVSVLPFDVKSYCALLMEIYCSVSTKGS